MSRERKRWNEKEDRLVVRGYRDGWSIEKIAASLGRSKVAVTQRASALRLQGANVRRRTPAASNRVRPAEMDQTMEVAASYITSVVVRLDLNEIDRDDIVVDDSYIQIPGARIELFRK